MKTQQTSTRRRDRSNTLARGSKNTKLSGCVNKYNQKNTLKFKNYICCCSLWLMGIRWNRAIYVSLSFIFCFVAGSINKLGVGALLLRTVEGY